MQEIRTDQEVFNHLSLKSHGLSKLSTRQAVATMFSLTMLAHKQLQATTSLKFVTTLSLLCLINVYNGFACVQKLKVLLKLKKNTFSPVFTAIHFPQKFSWLAFQLLGLAFMEVCVSSDQKKRKTDSSHCLRVPSQTRHT